MDPNIESTIEPKGIVSPSSKLLGKLGVFWILGLVAVLGIFYVGISLGPLISSSYKTKPIISKSPLPTVTINQTVSSLTPADSDIITPFPLTPPATYGFTKTISLDGIGVRAQFPPTVAVSLAEENLYVISASPSDQVTFTLKPYDGGGRRAWFQKEYPWAAGYQIESYAGTGHSGYIAYAVKTEDRPGPFFYFTVIGDRVLVVSGNNSISKNLNSTGENDSVFFTNDIQKFKSFLSGIEIISPQKITFETYPNPSELFRWSDTRKTIWEESGLGVKITAPEWTESRFTKGRDADGKFMYTEWTRAYPKAQTNPISYLSDTVSRTYVSGGYMSSLFLTVLPIRFQNKSFSEVASEVLTAAGFCETEWKNSKDECTSQYYCYTRDEVVQHLTMKKQIKIGSLDAQLRGMDPDFSNTNDCRSEDVWLIRAADGRYITSSVTPEGEAIRLEAR